MIPLVLSESLESESYFKGVASAADTRSGSAPSSAFPVDLSELDRAELESFHLQLRGSYGSLMRSRGQFRGRALRLGEEIREQGLQTFEQSEELAQLREQLHQVTSREAKLKAQTYAMLEQVTDVIEQLEDAGDELSKGFGAYQLGKRRPSGGSGSYGASGLMAAGASMPQLIKGVLHFLNRWRLAKQRFAQLSSQRDSLQGLLEDGDG